MKTYYIYILSSGKNGTLYVGVTNNLGRRVFEHKAGFIKGFTNKYEVDNLVYYVTIESIEVAIKREKQLKKWNRAWKLELIEAFNPNWHDLSQRLF